MAIGRADGSVFRFLDLPELVQELVLMQTDLISCTKLSSGAPFDLPISYPDTLPGQHKGLTTSLAPYELSSCLRCKTVRPLIQCGCWRFPSSIFLVSRKFNQLSKRIFYSCNKFTLWDTSRKKYSLDRRKGSDYRYLKDVSQALHLMPLHFLRWIQFYFLSFCRSDGRHDTPCYESWMLITTFLKEKVVASRLTIEIDYSFLNSRYTCGDDIHDLEEMWASYQNIVQLFKLYGGKYKDFFVRLASPMGDTYEDDRVRWLREQELEKLIMGDDYSAATRGKYYGRVINEADGPCVFFRETIIALKHGHHMAVSR